jgi:hypothetical protein
MKVYLDDERAAPSGWIGVQSATEAIRLLEAGQVTYLSLDHDLGDDASGTGYSVILWLEEAVASGMVPPIITVHTSNPSARVKMLLGIESIRRLAAERI